MIEIAPASEFKMTHDEAKLYCAFCNHDGYTDWRLPTWVEYQQHAIIGWVGDLHPPIPTFTWWTTPVRNHDCV